jgi:hypothetical protein
MYLRTRSRLHVAGIGNLDQQPASLPRVTRFVFRNQNGTTSAAANCCLICRTTLPDGRQAGSGFNLGVGQGGTASNGMEMQLFLSGHRSGLEYDVVRTRRDSMWERRGGVWTRLEIHPMGTSDDRFAADECLRPRNNRIFVVDRPGWPNIAVPQRHDLAGLQCGRCHPCRRDRGVLSVQLCGMGYRQKPVRGPSVDSRGAPGAKRWHSSAIHPLA